MVRGCRLMWLTFVEAALDVVETAQLFICRRPAFEAGYLATQLGPYIWILGQHKKQVTEQTRRGIPPGEQDIHGLIDDSLPILRPRGQLMRKNVLLLLLALTILRLLFLHFHLAFLFPHRPKRLVHKPPRKLPTHAVPLLRPSIPIKHAHPPQRAPRDNRPLRVLKRPRKLAAFLRPQRPRRLPKQELRRRVHGILKKQRLQVHCTSILRQHIHQILKELLKSSQIRNLLPRKGRPDERPRRRPVLAVRVKDARAQQRRKRGQPEADPVVGEAEREDRLDVLGLGGEDDAVVQLPQGEGLAVALEEQGLVAEERVPSDGTQGGEENVEVEEGVDAGEARDGLAVVLRREAGEGEAPAGVDVYEGDAGGEERGVG